MASPTVRRRAAAATLRRYREVAGLTGQQAADALGWHQSKIARIEGATSPVTGDDAGQLLDLYGITDPCQRDDLLRDVRLSHRRGWWSTHPYRGAFSSPLPAFEAGARTISTWEAQVVPGLLQTRGYADAVFRADADLDDEEIHARVQARMKRQDILTRPDPVHLNVVLDESALRRTVGGPEVMRDQYRHLAAMAQSATVELRVLPFDAGAHAGLSGSFDLLDFPDDAAPVVATESATSIVVAEQSHQVTRCRRGFSQLRSAALDCATTLRLITALGNGLR